MNLLISNRSKWFFFGSKVVNGSTCGVSLFHLSFQGGEFVDHKMTGKVLGASFKGSQMQAPLVAPRVICVIPADGRATLSPTPENARKSLGTAPVYH